MPNVVARASYTLEASWNAYNVGIFTFDTSTFDGIDTFGVSPFDTHFTGPNDDISSLFDQAHVFRGRGTGRDIVRAGSCTITLRDPDGLCNPENPSSPLYGELEDRLHPIRLRGKYAGTSYGIFYGWIRRSIWQPQRRRGTSELECVDLFWWLDRANPVIASTGPTTTGAAIGLILDSVGWVDPLARALDTGDAIPDFSADGSKTALQMIGDLLEAERGAFYINGQGVATYRSRLSRLTMSSLATLTNTMRDLGPGVDFEEVDSRVRVRRTQTTYLAEAVDDEARRKVGYSDYDFETSYLQSDTQADDLAHWLVAQLKLPRQPIYQLTIDNREPALLTQILARDLVDRITVNAVRGSIGGDFHIDQIDETITQQGHSAQWLVSRAGVGSPIRFDISTFGGPDLFVY